MACVRSCSLCKTVFERVVRICFSPGLTHREPLLDECDFQRFVATVDPLMKAGRDVMWVLVGRTESNLPKVRKALLKHKMNVEALYLCYDAQQMELYGYWKRQRGIANSKTVEQVLLAYKGTMPKNMPKNRLWVDPGSSLFNQVMKKRACARADPTSLRPQVPSLILICLCRRRG